MVNRDLIKIVANAKPDIFSHNLETVRSLSKLIRSKATYDKSLQTLEIAASRGLTTKSGIMVGLGEKFDEVLDVMDDLLNVNCRILTIGQYLQPSKKHWPVHKYYTPEEFKQLSEIGQSLGIPAVVSGPMVRSSYLADQYFSQLSEPHNH